MEWYLILFISILLSVLFEYFEKDGQTLFKQLCFILLVTVLVCFAGLRNMAYTVQDETLYRNGVLLYSTQPFNFQKIGLLDESGFYLYQWCIAHLFHSDQIFIFLSSFFTITSILLFLKKYSTHFSFSILLFISLGEYYTTFNVLRQFLAIAIVIWSFEYIKERNLLKFSIIILVAGLFHKSAFFLFLIYFLYGIKLNKYTLLGSIVGCIIIFNNFDSIFTFLISNSFFSNYAEIENAESNMIGRLVYVIPSLLVLFNYKKLRKSTDSKLLFILLLTFMVLQIFTYKFKFLARIASYLSLSYVILVPCLSDLFVKKQQKIILFLISIFYLIYYVFFILDALPYRFFIF